MMINSNDIEYLNSIDVNTIQTLNVCFDCDKSFNSAFNAANDGHIVMMNPQTKEWAIVIACEQYHQLSIHTIYTLASIVRSFERIDSNV